MGIDQSTPFNYSRGTLDDSTRARDVLPSSYPQLLPVFILETQRGGYETERVSGNLTDFIYGDETLNKIGKYVNHASVFAAGILGVGSQVLVKRVPFTPPADQPDATGIADITIYANISEATTSKNFLRNPDGSIQKNNAGEAQLDTTDASVRYYSLSAKSNANGDIINTAAGMTVGGTSLATVSYPLFTVKALAHGEDYNNFGIALTAFTGSEVNSKLKEINEMAYGLSLYYNSNGTAKLQKTETAAKFISFSLKDGAIDPVLNKVNTLGQYFPADYGFKPNPTSKREYNNFSDVIMYQSNIDILLKEICGFELAQSEGTHRPYSDFNSIDGNDTTAKKEKLFALANLFTNKYTSGAKYEFVRQTALVTPSADLILASGKTFTASLETPVYLENGMDNVLTTTTYENAVLDEISKYSNPDEMVSEVLINPVSLFIDTGLSFNTKLKLGKFLGHRKDVFLLGSSYEVDVSYNGTDKQPLADALGKTNLLKSAYKLYPESTLFNTPTSRSSIVIGSMLLKDGTFRKRVPLTYDYVLKMARFMGAGNGKWNPVYRFSRMPLNIVSDGVDIDPAFIPASIKNKLNDAGAIWAQNKDRDTYFYPQSQTIYDNPTSVLRALPINIALCYIVKKEEEAWSEVTGSDDLSNTRIKILVEEKMNKKLEGCFASSFKIVPEVFYTKTDLDNGYSYKLVVHVYANNMKTVQESYNVVHRMGTL